MMTYPETLEYLYSQLPVFHRVGAPAYKAGLDNIIALCTHLANPQSQYPCLHVAGTNGKGSSSHFLAAILQSAGYKVGLYTSPHLKDFSERIRVNGQPVAQDFVVSFVEKHKELMLQIQPSFFEITVAMAFQYFAEQKVDIAVIEVGMGGRLDSTNIITPIVSLITNIGFDHQAFLGDTLPAIASEKAGIIKPHVPVVISEYHRETAKVFNQKADDCQAPLYFATTHCRAEFIDEILHYVGMKGMEKTIGFGIAVPELQGSYQHKNIMGVLTTIALLKQQGWQIAPEHIKKGLEKVVTLTGLKGRWQILQQEPLIVCDVAHNEAGIFELLLHLKSFPHEELHLIVGFSADKDMDKIWGMFGQFAPKAHFHFCAYNAPRSMKAEDLADFALQHGIEGTMHADVNTALAHCRARAGKADLVLVCGSIFLIAEIAEL